MKQKAFFYLDSSEIGAMLQVIKTGLLNKYTTDCFIETNKTLLKKDFLLVFILLEGVDIPQFYYLVGLELGKRISCNNGKKQFL